MTVFFPNQYIPYLVGGFNPFEKYKSKWESSPNRNENKKNLKPPPRYIYIYIIYNIGINCPVFVITTAQSSCFLKPPGFHTNLAGALRSSCATKATSQPANGTVGIRISWERLGWEPNRGNVHPQHVGIFFGSQGGNEVSGNRFWMAENIWWNRGTPKWMVYNGKPY